MAKGKAIAYSSAEIAWLDANRLMPISDYHRAFCEAFDREDVAAANLASLRKRMGWKTGRTGRIEAGATPHNKGKRCAPGQGGNNPNARATQFRKGERRGVAVKLYKPIGTERISKDGYTERKIHDGMPLQSRWRAVQLLRWEAINGPLPNGMALKCLDSDKTNTDPANWEAIPRAMLPRLNGGSHKAYIAYDEAEAEVKPAIMAAAKLDHKARAQRARLRGGMNAGG